MCLYARMWAKNISLKLILTEEFSVLAGTREVQTDSCAVRMGEVWHFTGLTPDCYSLAPTRCFLSLPYHCGWDIGGAYLILLRFQADTPSANQQCFSTSGNESLGNRGIWSITHLPDHKPCGCYGSTSLLGRLRVFSLKVAQVRKGRNPDCTHTAVDSWGWCAKPGDCHCDSCVCRQARACLGLRIWKLPI